VREALRLLQQLLNVIEVETGPCMESLCPNLKGLCRRSDEPRTHRRSERVVQRPFEGMTALIGRLLQLSGEIVIEQKRDSFSHMERLKTWT